MRKLSPIARSVSAVIFERRRSGAAARRRRTPARSALLRRRPGDREKPELAAGAREGHVRRAARRRGRPSSRPSAASSAAGSSRPWPRRFAAAAAPAVVRAVGRQDHREVHRAGARRRADVVEDPVAVARADMIVGAGPDRVVEQQRLCAVREGAQARRSPSGRRPPPRARPACLRIQTLAPSAASIAIAKPVDRARRPSRRDRRSARRGASSTLSSLVTIALPGPLRASQD